MADAPPSAPADAARRREQTAALALAGVRGVGAVIGGRIVRHFGSAAAAAAATAAQFAEIEGVTPAGASSFGASLDLRGAERELDRALAAGFEVLSLADAGYPRSLGALGDAPVALWIDGTLRPEDAGAVAIVGTRGASKYGRDVARRLAGDLARAGVTVVSGLARGIDTAAHEGALEAGGRTLAVLGCGLDKVYPPENRSLARRIAGSGAIVSEFPLGTDPVARNFPRRNRIISGLSAGVVVVEASERSGALITARTALDQGRDVFAVPGPIGAEGSRGPHALIKAGAKLIESVADILDELPARAARGPLKVAGRPDDPMDGPRAGPPVPPDSAPQDLAALGEAARAVWALLGAEPRHVDEVAAAASLRSADVSAALVELELAGLVRPAGGMRFVRT